MIEFEAMGARVHAIINRTPAYVAPSDGEAKQPHDETNQIGRWQLRGMRLEPLHAH